METALLQDLKRQIDSSRVAVDPESLETYGRDWTKQYDVKPGAVVFPTSAEEVVALVKWARAKKIGLVPSGGRTGLSGGACALNGEVVVSFEKMNRVLDFNPIDRTITVEAGMITEALQEKAKEKGFYYPVDFAARGSAQIGGNVATNAGGVKVLRYGLTRDWVAGLKVVTGAGEILELGGSLVKNATGFDLRHLFVGSEGTLGFVTEVTLRLAAPPKPLTVMVLGVPDLDSVMKVFQVFRDKLPLTAFEMFSDKALAKVIEHAHLTKPFATDVPNYLLVEVENTDPSVEELALATFESCVEQGWVVDGAIAQSDAQARDFWRLREDVSEATSSYSPYKNDVSVRISRVPQFLKETDEVLTKAYPDFEVVWFGHIGDGNMHINILKPANLDKETFVKKCEHVNDLLFGVIKKLGGSISAEHGVGILKKPYLGLSRSPGEIDIMKGIKKVLDPDGIMNPGKIF
jgi:glycolate oxidase subunit GlcD